MQKAPPTPKGFRDIKWEIAKKRRKVISTIVEVLEKQGFSPIETPTIEFADTLTGKYGEEERLIYKFTDRGGRNLALRFDLTIPLARYVATYQHEIKFPFKRYQIGQVFRGENPQHGRYREFTQFDFDTVGPESIGEDIKLNEDAVIIAVAINTVRSINDKFKKATMAINDRNFFEGLPGDVIIAWDKYHKIGMDGVKKELSTKKIPSNKIEKYIKQLEPPRIASSFSKLKTILEEKWGLKDKKDFFFDRTLARGLDYYTGLIFELKPTDKPGDLSIGAGGRYDNLIGMFAKRNIPATGFSFGLDRLVDLI